MVVILSYFCWGGTPFFWREIVKVPVLVAPRESGETEGKKRSEKNNKMGPS